VSKLTIDIDAHTLSALAARTDTLNASGALDAPMNVEQTIATMLAILVRLDEDEQAKVARREQQRTTAERVRQRVDAAGLTVADVARTLDCGEYWADLKLRGSKPLTSLELAALGERLGVGVAELTS